jgi:hypothetical protein
MATPEICPVCGEDHLSGWREDADETGGLDLPEQEFDYENFVKKEFGSGVKPEGIAWAWWAAAAAALLAFIAIVLRGAW